jgi:hypothetical protein
MLGGRPRPLLGSELLRIQMLEGLKAFLPENIDFGITNFGGRLLTFERWLALQRPAIFILSKKLAYSLGPERLDLLRRKKAILLGVDHKDGDISKIDLSQFDLHIAASHAGERAMKRLIDQGTFSNGRPACGLLFQAPDARLRDISPRPLNALKAAYVGLLENASIPEGIAGEVKTFEVRNDQDMAKVLPSLAHFNFHYAVRPESADGLLRAYKPFTKGFTAAALRSNVIVNRATDDAVDLLSEDYPYLVSNTSADEILRVFRHAQDGYGSPEWEHGLRIMKEIRNRVTPEAGARQLSKLILDAVG